MNVTLILYTPAGGELDRQTVTVRSPDDGVTLSKLGDSIDWVLNDGDMIRVEMPEAE